MHAGRELGHAEDELWASTIEQHQLDILDTDSKSLQVAQSNSKRVRHYESEREGHYEYVLVPAWVYETPSIRGIRFDATTMT